MEFGQFGSENGRLVVYFHGAPGAPEECAIFHNCGKENGLKFVCFERFSVASSISGEAYYQLLAKGILQIANGSKVDVIGFSIGAFVALQTCRHMASEVRSLHLVSAAAPLEAGDFLNAMAGKHVFQLAKAFPVLFKCLSYWQAMLALLFPNVLFRIVFARSVGGDKALVANREFQSSIIKSFKSCFIGGIQGYTRDIKAYVHPWTAALDEISVNTHVWHGAADNWSPKLMAEYLKSAIPSCSHMEIVDGLSHYSCLYAAVPKICRQLGKA